MLAHSGFKRMTDKAWAPCKERPTSKMKDIFDAEVLCNFKGLDGQHFSTGSKEGQYVFSLCINYFNPLGNKQTGKKKSIGLIPMVCLNLKNMFLFGIIPGLNEPLLACFNQLSLHRCLLLWESCSMCFHICCFQPTGCI